MALKFAVALCVLLIERGAAQDCPYTVSVLDVPGVQCTTSLPCSGTYYATGLTQGVGACPTGSSCALLPLTPIMGCAAAGRPDLIYVNGDGTLTKGGRSVTLSGTIAIDVTLAPSTSSSSSSGKSKTRNSGSRSGSNRGSSSSSGSHPLSGSNSDSNASSGSHSTSSSSNGSGDKSNASDSGSGTNNSTNDDDNSSNSTSFSWSSDSGSGSVTISPGSSSANQQAEFNPGSILSDSSKTKNTSSDGGLGLGSIIAIVVGCLAVVAIAAGARLLKKGKEAELATPEAAAEAYNNGGGGGGGGMTPKENVLLL